MVAYHYPKCTTCKRALAFLRENGIAYTEKHIVEEVPSKEELRAMIVASQLPIQKFFNTSGIKYREMGLAKKLKEMDEAQKLDLLASDGMLIKRPIVVDGNKVTVGFNEDMYTKVWMIPGKLDLG